MASKEKTTVKLTERFCQTRKTDGRVTYFDDHQNSWKLQFRVTRKSKSWAVRYRIKGTRRLYTLGNYPALSLQKAREKSLEYGALVADGIDPQQAERDAQVAAMTFGALAGEYIEACKRHQRSWKETERIFENHILPALGQELVTEIDRGRVLELLDDLEGKGLTTQVNRVLSQIKSALSWAVEERQYLPASPIATLHRKKRRVREQSRDRILSRKELKAIWKAADGLSQPSRSFIKLLMLTGQRRDEVRCMDWFELDLDEKEWTIPAKRTKAKRAHLLPLSDVATEILKAWHSETRFRDKGPVFTINGRNPYAGVRRLKEILDRESGVKDWVFHDLRRTFSTGLSSLKVEPQVRRRCLNHTVGTALDRTYDLHDFRDEKRAAMVAWADFLLRAVGEVDASNVVELAAVGGDR